MSTPPIESGPGQSFVFTTDEPTVHHESPRQKREMPPAKMTLNLTSMIDVIFQLLIYFVVTVSFAAGEGIIAASLPGQGQGAATAELPKTPLNINVISRGQYSYQLRIDGISQTPADFKQLAQLLEQLQNDPQRGRAGAYPPDNPIMIKPDTAVRWQHVVDAFNAALSARYSNISFAQATGE